MSNRRLTCFDIVYGSKQPGRLIPVLVQTVDDSLLPQGDGYSVRIGSTGIMMANNSLLFENVLSSRKSRQA